MRKIIENIELAGLAVLISFGIFFASYIESHYSRNATIIDQETATLYLAEDETGNLWEFEGSGFSIGDKVVLQMNNNGTDSNIYDDEVVKVRLKK